MTRHSRTLPQARRPKLERPKELADVERAMTQLLGYVDEVLRQANVAYQLASQASEELLMSAPFAQRPTVGVANRIFFATDTGVTYFDDGTTWRVV